MFGDYLYLDARIRRWLFGAEATVFFFFFWTWTLYAFLSFMSCYVGLLNEGLERRGRGVPGFRIGLAVGVSYRWKNARSGATCDLSLFEMEWAKQTWDFDIWF